MHIIVNLEILFLNPFIYDLTYVVLFHFCYIYLGMHMWLCDWIYIYIYILYAIQNFHIEQYFMLKTSQYIHISVLPYLLHVTVFVVCMYAR